MKVWILSANNIQSLKPQFLLTLLVNAFVDIKISINLLYSLLFLSVNTFINGFSFVIFTKKFISFFKVVEIIAFINGII